MGTGYARLVRPRDLVHFQDVQLCPLVVQAYVRKTLEVRVTVVGSDVFAAEIHSQATRRTLVDWRRYDRTNTPHAVHTLPPEIAERCLGLVRAMGLAYGAIDLVLTPEGHYVFLEINPNGQYMWIEHLTGLPITDRLVRLLVERA
jgi:glutathione synthase/RimK-type ligase-like ATP-grasp enzyme